MAKLTAKQEQFCLEYVKGKGTASDAYRAVYDCTRMLPATVNRNAFSLVNNNKVATRIAELRKQAADAAVVTLEGHLNDLRVLRDAAADAEQYSAAISAEISRGKAAGLYTEKQQVDLRTLIVDFGAGNDGN